MTSRFRNAIVVTVLLAVFAWTGAAGQRSEMAQVGAPPSASSPAQSEPGTLHLHGAVVDGVTGKPVARALVTSNDRRLATMTNNEGVFALDVDLSADMGPATRNATAAGGVALPQLYLSAQKPGYLPQGTRPAGISFDLSTQAPPLQLKLMPAGAVTGRVSDEHSEAAHRVFVDLMFRSANNGERTWNRIAMHRTDADGSFRFGSLNPGEYTVMTEEWRGEQPLPPGRDAITEQYPPVYLGDAADLTSANKLHLHFGETAAADLHLHTATYYPVSIPVTGNADAFVNVRITGRDAETGFHLGYVPGRHAVEGSLPNGTYGLELTSYVAANRQAPSPPNQGQERTYGFASLHVVGAAVRTSPVALVVPAPIAVRLHREFSAKETPERFDVRVYLQPVGQGQAFLTASTEQGSGDEFPIPGAAPGKYTVRVEPSYGYAAQVRCGGVDLRGESLTVESGGSQPIDIVLRDDVGAVSGTVVAPNPQPSTSGQPNVQTSFVVLSPVNGEGRFNMTGTGPDGRFSMPYVAPGRYRAFAIDGTLWDSPYRDPEALRSLGDKGIAVNVVANSKLQLEVPTLDAAALEIR